MIRPLRSAHRWVFLALAVLLPLLFALALRARQGPAPVEPPGLLHEATGAGSAGVPAPEVRR